MYNSLSLCFFLIPFYTTFIVAQQENSHTQPPIVHKDIVVHVEIPQGDFIHKELLSLHMDHPHAKIVSWQPSIDAVNKYDPLFKEDKKVFDRPFNLTINMNYPDDTHDVNLHVSYYRHSMQGMQEEVIPIHSISIEKNTDIKETNIAIDSTDSCITEMPINNNTVANDDTNNSFSCYVQEMVQKTDNIWLRLLLIALLGMLMSLTPCIYPMIPITIGILQSQSSGSIGRNFLLAGCYSLGIATMFAFLGLLAASTGQMFGAIMSNPLVIISIVGLLIYLAFSMLGFYEMYVPRFMSNNNNKIKNGSLFSVFLFGFISGSVASPCLSPGLILLLTLVTTIKSKFLGFIMLFSFGVGLSIPLLIVGTFSSALNALPRAGMWMVEVKKFFGFMLIGMCFYFLHMIMPWYLLITAVTISSLLTGIFYLYHAHKSNGFIKRLNTALGIICIIATCILTVESYKAFIIRNQCPTNDMIWITEYSCAREKAIAQHKPLLIKVGGPCCSICTAIDNKQFAHKAVLQRIEQSLVAVKINGALMNDEISHIKKTYTIHGFPTILIVDPITETIIKRWESNLYDVDPLLFAQELNEISVVL